MLAYEQPVWRGMGNGRFPSSLETLPILRQRFAWSANYPNPAHGNKKADTARQKMVRSASLLYKQSSALLSSLSPVPSAETEQI